MLPGFTVPTGKWLHATTATYHRIIFLSTMPLRLRMAFATPICLRLEIFRIRLSCMRPARERFRLIASGATKQPTIRYQSDTRRTKTHRKLPGNSAGTATGMFLTELYAVLRRCLSPSCLYRNHPCRSGCKE